MSGEPVRASGRARGATRDDRRAILVLLALGLIFRAIIAYLLPGSGFSNDIGAFQYWAANLASQGLYGFYDRPFFHDYTPGYLYVLWLVGIAGHLLGGVGDLVKVPPILGDLALAYLVWSMTLELGGSRRAARLGALIVAINPITWLDSVIWSQVDSVGVVFLLLGLRELWRDRPERAAVLTVIAAITKPQLGILVPIVAIVTIRRALRPEGGFGGEGPPERRATTTRWEAEARGWIRIASTGVAGFVTAIALSLPFGLSLPGLVDQIFKTAGGYPYVSVNAWNPWALVSFQGDGIALNHQWVCDSIAAKCPIGFSIGALPAVVFGAALLVIVFLGVGLVVALRPDRRTILMATVVLAVAFFVVPTRVHERYLYPLVPLGAMLAAVSWRWRIAYLASGLATIANMYFVLTTLYPTNPGISDWLRIGPTLGSFGVIATAAIIQLLVFAFAATQLRPAALDRLAVEFAVPDEPDELEEEAGPPAVPAPLGAAAGTGVAASSAAALDRTDVASVTGVPGAAESALPTVPGSGTARPMPVWDERPGSGELGFLGWFRHRLAERPIRLDRSRSLHGELGGQVDKLDIWIMVVLAAVLLGSRMWRLAEPYQMHFDEVYHPRTAIEFLQDWRYGISHDIYEWTHPHVAKYAMAGGLVAWGDDRTTATSSLGVQTLDAEVEPRWDDGTSNGRIEGDRLWVATGTEVRAYDLATRALVISLPVAGAEALAVDQVSHRVFVGTSDGAIDTIDTLALDAARWAGSSAAGSTSARAFATTSAAVGFLHVTPDGGSLVAVEPAPRASGTATASDTAIEIDTSSASEVGRATIGKVAQVADAGTGLVAFATPSGVPFLDTTSGKLTTTVALSGPAEGIAFVTNLDKDRLYVSVGDPSGPRMTTIVAPGLGASPTVETSFALPGTSAGWVGYDLASQMVHVLGAHPGTDEATVYVIEPHSNGVYADAQLPFWPTSIVVDQNQRYPSSDRQQLLAFGPAGAAASVDIGHHAFAWRVPGVLAGVLMAVLLYLLTRLLFRRREIAVFLSILIAADGMLFAQSRIGMNDSYVGLGIVAAYVLFAAIWRSPGHGWRHWLAFWLGMPAVGVALGFGLASKWVAAYAIGALGILVLTRSALGRLLLVLGMIGATTVLGYMALAVPQGESGANYPFVAIMIGLTLVTVAANVLHPVAWSDEEERLLVYGPAGAGLVLLGAAVATHLTDRAVHVGGFAVTPVELAFGLVVGSAVLFTLVRVVGRWGFGPRAVPPAPDDPARLLDPPSPPPEGWHRPGAFAGLPMVWALVCLIAIPVVLYVISYIPWANVQDYRLWPDVVIAGHLVATSWPLGHGGQTLWELTQQMYRYHNDLSSPHPASSPWWAWIFDFKPVWFYQGGFAGGTAASIYDAGNLVAWWLGIPAMGFAAWQAFARRSPALALVAIGLAAQWLGWARIDRAAFQYHYYTSLPFLFIALAYFLAELWRGASRRTWLLARLSAAAAVLAPTTLWLFHRPLCGFVRVTDVNPGSQACPTLIPDFELSGRAAAIAVIVGIGVLLLVRLLLSLADEDRLEGGGLWTRLRTAVIAAVGVSVAFVAASVFLDDTPIISSHNIPVEPIALGVTIALVPLAAIVATARDARRFVAGIVVAIVGWFVLWYPNISALPLPQALSNSYQGFLPTYVYPFQFPVSTVNRAIQGPSLIGIPSLLLLLALCGVSLIVGYAAWVWRIALAEQAEFDAGAGANLPRGPGSGAPA